MKLATVFVLWQALSLAGPLALHFEKNVGQTGGQVQYVARVRGATIFVEDDGFILYRSSGKHATKIQVCVEGTNRSASWQPQEPVSGTTSYLIGNDPLAWISDVPHFQRLVRKDIYPGVDLILYGVEGRLEYDFILAPGVDASQIRTRITGTNGLQFAPNGDLVLALFDGSILQKKPHLYQTNSDGTFRQVDGEYVLLGEDEVGFAVHDYDRGRPLTIDPVLESATLLGGSGDDRIFFADPTSAVIGSTTSVDFPGVETGRHSGVDIFIYNPQTQSTMILGGSGDDIVTSVSIGSGIRGGALIGGYTNSRDFPVTGSGPPFYSQIETPQRQYGGGDWDGFLLYFYYAGSNQPALSTYLGGSGDDRVLAVHVDGTLLAVAGSTTSPDFPLRNAWQTAAAGGLDGFATVIQGITGSVLASSYLGGSGDDRVLATHVVASAAGMDLYLAGDTLSTDWQPSSTWTGARNGPSDGFVLHLKSKDLFAPFMPSEGLFLGGSGEDRVNALTQLDTGSVMAAGVTSSPDFPVTTTSQYGGGTSDAFVVELSADLQTRLYSSLLGGSGAEEPLAIATNQFHEVLIGGWTNSSDFPVKDPLPSSCGRGPEDGFLVYLDASFQTMLSTCYGGTGSDRTNSVGFGDVQRILIGGATDSPDLPLKNAVQAGNAGALDGFFAEITVPVLHANDLSVGKDLSGLAYVQLGDSSNYVGVPLTVTSTDPSRVLVAIRPDDPGQSSVTISNGAANDFPGRNFWAGCLVDSGKISIRLSAPGYPSKNINVACWPSGLYIGKADLSIPPQGQQGSITVVTAAFDPVSQAILQVQNPRGGLDPIRVDASTSNSNVQLGTSTVTIDSFTSLVLPSGSFNPNAISFQLADFGGGDITLTTAAPFSFVPSNTVHVHRAPGISMFVSPMARDLVGNIFVTFTPPLPNGVSFTLTSSDPSKARITANPSLNGQASLTFPSGALTFVEVLDDTGNVSISASAPGYDPITTSVSIFPLTGGLFDTSNRPLQNASLSVGSSLVAQIFLYPDFPLNHQSTWELRAGAAPIQMRLETLDNTIASPVTITGTFGPGNETKLGAQIKGLAFGTATFTLHLSAPVPVPLKPGSLRVDVFDARLVLSPVTVGSNLMTQVPFSAPGPILKNPFTVTITSSDPSRILLSPDTQTPGQPSITVTSPFNSIFVQSLVNSGFVDVIATSDGYQSARATITSVPAGFAWTNPTITLGQGSAGNSPTGTTLAVYALDPGDLTPMVRQSTRPGLSGSLALQNSDASVVSLSADNIPLATFNSTPITLTPAGEGDAQIAITQPLGFVQPIGHGPLHVKVLPPSIKLSVRPLGRNMQVALAIAFVNLPPGQTGNPPVTITSSDPSKLLVSASDSVIGSASVTILSRPADGYPTVYLQALDGPADVKIVASARGLADSSTIVPILASSVVLTSNYAFPTQGIEMNTQQDPQAINIATIALLDSALYTPGAAQGVLRAGLDPIPVSIRSSNPSVAAAVSNPILNSLTGQAAFQLKALSPGGTELSVIEPPGFVAPLQGYARSVHVSVQGPSFAIPDVVLGQDLQVATTLAVLSGAAILPDDVDVSISSSDASKLLISTNPASIGTGSLTIHFFKNTQSSRPIYLQALDQAGTVSVQITAAGYGSSSANVTLAPTTFATDQSSVLGAIPNVNLTFRLRPVPLTTPNSFYGGLNYTFRPGVASYTIGASSSDPGVATISNPALTVSSGSSELDFSIQTISAGTATINFSVPDPYVAPPAVTVNVQGGRLMLSSVTVGKDLQDQLFINGDNIFRDSVTVTVTSSDPSHLLVSPSPATPGQASASVVYRQGQQFSVFVQALAGSGTVKVTASSPGYQTAGSEIQLTASSVILFNQPSANPLTTSSPPVPLEARLAPYPQNFSPVIQALRAGASPVSVQVSLSDMHVGSVTPTQVLFNPGDSRQPFSFQPLAAGSTLVSLSVPSGFVDPLSLRQVLLTVIAPRLTTPADGSTGSTFR